MAGLNLLTSDIFRAFPDVAKQSDDDEWRSLADIINNLDNEWLKNGHSDGSLSVDQLADIFKCEKIPSLELTLLLTDMLNVRYFSSDSQRVIQQKICATGADRRIHATTLNIKDQVEACTGFRPSILSTAGYSGGWDENNTITDPPTQADFQNGNLWDEDDTHLSVLEPTPFIWNSTEVGILVDLKNDGSYTLAQFQCAMAVLAELKDAGLSLEVGWIDTGTGAKVIFTVIYSTAMQVTSGDLNTTAVITNIPSTSGWATGYLVNGVGIAVGTTILSVDSDTQITLDTAVTVTDTTHTITVQPPINTEIDPGI